jgi:hypothetical protein
MIVVSDTSPILYLLLINQINLLPQLSGQVIIRADPNPGRSSPCLRHRVSQKDNCDPIGQAIIGTNTVRTNLFYRGKHKMTKPLTILLPEDLELKLTAQARKLNLSLENLILQSLEQSVSQPELDQNDPLVQLFGSIKTDIKDVADNHDDYIGQTLYEELRSAE